MAGPAGAPISAEAAEEQADELTALREIFGEDCEVQCEEPGRIMLSLRITVDFGLGDAPMKVLCEEPGDPPHAGGAAGPTSPGAASASSSAPPPGSYLSVQEMAAERLKGPEQQLGKLERTVSAGGSERVTREVAVEHLTPLTLQLSFPQSYPAESPPDFHLSCIWLSTSQLSRLCREMDERAEDCPGSPIVFTWAEMLKVETPPILDLGDSVTLRSPPDQGDEGCVEVGDARALCECWNAFDSLMEISVYSEKRKLELWRQNIQTCMICFSDLPGIQFTHLGGCSHAYCQGCLSQMASLHVREGSLADLRCPDPKCRAEISPAALEEVLEDSEYERWYRLKLQQIISAELKGVILCPRCGDLGTETPVQAEEPKEEGEAPLAECRRCGYMFCGKCLDVYHQNLSDCTPADAMALKRAMRKEGAGVQMTLAQRREIQKAAKGFVVQISFGDAPPPFDSAGFLTEDYGEKGHAGDEVTTVETFEENPKDAKTIWQRDRHALEALGKALEARPITIRIRPPKGLANDRLKSRRVMEELLSLKAISENSQGCPQCHITVMRSEGCNHMTCTICRTHFCYRCGRTLNPTDPYSHFKSGGCPTFDKSEVDRIALRERQGNGGDQALEELRRQFGNQQHLFEQFQHRRTGQAPIQGSRARHLANGDSQCPTCGQWNARSGTLNHVRCQHCRGSYCHCCRKKIVGVVPVHYRGPGACPMHGDAAAA